MLASSAAVSRGEGEHAGLVKTDQWVVGEATGLGHERQALGIQLDGTTVSIERSRRVGRLALLDLRCLLREIIVAAHAGRGGYVCRCTSLLYAVAIHREGLLSTKERRGGRKKLQP
jgi:hypothetical protein